MHRLTSISQPHFSSIFFLVWSLAIVLYYFNTHLVLIHYWSLGWTKGHCIRATILRLSAAWHSCTCEKLYQLWNQPAAASKSNQLSHRKAFCSIAINSFLVTQRVWEWGCEVFNDLRTLVFLGLSSSGGFVFFFNLFIWWWGGGCSFFENNRICMFPKQNIWRHGALCPIDLLSVFSHFLPSCLISMMAIKGTQERCVCHSWGACLTTTHGQLAWTFLLLQMKHGAIPLKTRNCGFSFLWKKNWICTVVEKFSYDCLIVSERSHLCSSSIHVFDQEYYKTVALWNTVDIKKEEKKKERNTF